MCIYWLYCLVDHYVWARCHITSILYKMDTSLRLAVKAGPEGVRLGEVWLYTVLFLDVPKVLSNVTIYLYFR